MKAPSIPASAILASGIHRHARVAEITDAEIRPENIVSGWQYADWLVSRGRADSQESRRAWRAGR